MNKIEFLKKVDSVVGRFLAVFLPQPKVSSVPEYKNLLFIRPGGIGDAVLLIPVLQALKNKYPAASIDVLAEKRNAAIFDMCPEVNNVLLYDQGHLLVALKSKYDVVVDTEQWHRLSAVVARLIRSGVKIGYGTNERKKLFTHVVDYSHERYELDSFFDLVKPMGVEPPDLAMPSPFLKVPAAEQDKASRLLNQFKDSSYVVLFPGASIPERRWGAAKFHGLAARLNEAGYPVVVIGGQEDHEAGEKILSGVDGLNLAGKTSLVGSAAVIENTALLVSGDSGMLHIGVGLGRPTVSLFGSGIAAKWAPRGACHVVLNKNLPCSPCTSFGYTPPCPVNAQCMRDIAVEDVLGAALSLLKKAS